MKTPHTPAPWIAKICKGDAMSDILAPNMGDDYRIAYVLKDSNKHQEQTDIANAKLIAAAPALHAALKAIIEKMYLPMAKDASEQKFQDYHVHPAIIEAAAKALAAAE